jgi:hypothetical protein
MGIERAVDSKDRTMIGRTRRKRRNMRKRSCGAGLPPHLLLHRRHHRHGPTAVEPRVLPVPLRRTP